MEDAKGRITNLEYDYVNRLVKLVEPNPGLSGESHRNVDGQVLDTSGRPVTTFVYDNVGNLRWTSDALGNDTFHHYDALNRPTAVIHSRPESAFTIPERAALLVGGEVLDAPATRIQYTAGPGGWHQTITDPLGRVLDIQYDFLGRTSSTAEPAVAGQRPVTQFAYFADSLPKSVLDAEQNTTEYEYDNRGRLKLTRLADPGDGSHGRPEIKYSYDEANQLQSVEDPLNRVTKYTYDLVGRVTAVIPPEPAGNGLTDGPNSPTLRYLYDSAGNLLQIHDKIDREAGFVTSYDYDYLFRRTSETDGKNQQTQFEYDLVHNMTKLIDPNSNDTTWVYDDLDRVYQELNVFDDARTYKYDAVGNLRQAVDRLDRATRYDYDHLYRMTEEAWLPQVPGDPNGYVVTAMGTAIPFTGSDPPNSFVLAQIETTLEGLAEVVDAEVKVTNGRLDITVRETDSTRLVLNDPMGVMTIETVQDTEGLVGVNGAMVPALSWEDGFFQLSYNGDMTNEIPYNSEGARISSFTQLPFSPLQDEINDLIDQPNTFAFVYGGDGEPWRIQFTDDELNVLANQPLLSVDDPHDIVSITPGFDENGQPVQVLSVNAEFTLTFGGETTEPIPYNATKERIEVALQLLDTVHAAHASGGPRERQYIDSYFDLDDSVSHPWVIKLNGAVSYSHEDLSALPVNVLSYDYDLVGNLRHANDPVAEYNFVYDDLNRVSLEQIDYLGGLPQDMFFEHQYDLVGNRTELAGAIGGKLFDGGRVGGSTDFVTSYGYDGLYRMTSVKQTGASAAAKYVTFTYDVSSQLTDVNRYAADSAVSSSLVAHSQYDYDKVGRLTDVTHLKPGSTIADYDFVYDKANRLTQFGSHGAIDNFFADYTYDDRNQLIGADYTGTVAGLPTALQDENYGYDDNGNRLNANGTSRSPDGTDNRLQTNGTHKFAYDAEGNRIAKFVDANGTGQFDQGDTDITEYTWDHRNRLTKITERDTYTSAVDKVIDYLYDVFDRRVSKTVDPDGNGSQTAYRDFYVYDGPHIALEFHDSDANGSSVAVVSHRYLHGPRIDMILADEQIVSGSGPGQVFWALPDHLGSTRDVIDSSGNIVTHFVYNTFGQITGETNPNFKFRFTFTGRERDAETPGLMYYRARYYSTTEGVFISSDPSGFSAGDANLARYVGNNVTTFTDPSGLEGVGHHFFPQKYLKLFLEDGLIDADSFLLGMGYTSGPLTEHLYDRAHADFSDRVAVLFHDYYRENGSKKICKEQMKSFIDSVASGRNPLTGKTDTLLRRYLQHQIKSKLIREFTNDNIDDLVERGLRYGPARSFMEGLSERAGKRLSDRLKRLLGQTGAKRASRAIPVAGALVTFYFWTDDVEARGFGWGTANSLLDACPGIGAGKFGVEVLTGSNIIETYDEAEVRSARWDFFKAYSRINNRDRSHDFGYHPYLPYPVAP